MREGRIFVVLAVCLLSNLPSSFIITRKPVTTLSRWKNAHVVKMSCKRQRKNKKNILQNKANLTYQSTTTDVQNFNTLSEHPIDSLCAKTCPRTSLRRFIEHLIWRLAFLHPVGIYVSVDTEFIWLMIHELHECVSQAENKWTEMLKMDNIQQMEAEVMLNSWFLPWPLSNTDYLPIKTFERVFWGFSRLLLLIGKEMEETKLYFTPAPSSVCCAPLYFFNTTIF